jgi:hypothetical protein
VCACREESSLTVSIPEAQLFFREGLKESIGQNKPRRFLERQASSLQTNGSLPTARPRLVSPEVILLFTLLSFLYQIREIGVCVEYADGVEVNGIEEYATAGCISSSDVHDLATAG